MNFRCEAEILTCWLEISEQRCWVIQNIWNVLQCFLHVSALILSFYHFVKIHLVGCPLWQNSVIVHYFLKSSSGNESSVQELVGSGLGCRPESFSASWAWEAPEGGMKTTCVMSSCLQAMGMRLNDSGCRRPVTGLPPPDFHVTSLSIKIKIVCRHRTALLNRTEAVCNVTIA